VPKNAILAYQQKVARDYPRAVGLPRNYTYPDGNPIRPLPPFHVATRGLMIVGAYPSARFEARPTYKDRRPFRLVPIADNLHPFAKEDYFDGLRPRSLESGLGLLRYLLHPLHLSSEECWITDLVKVFLYKPEHVSSCGAVHPRFHVPVLRDKFHYLGTKSLSWLRSEAEICQPKLIVTLGVEVAQVVSASPRASADDILRRPISNLDSLGGYPVLHLPHPDACRRWEKWRNNLARRRRLVVEALGLA